MWRRDSYRENITVSTKKSGTKKKNPPLDETLKEFSKKRKFNKDNIFDIFKRKKKK